MERGAPPRSEEMEEVIKRTEDLSLAVLMSAVCSADNGFVVDPRKAAVSMYELGVYGETGLSTREIGELNRIVMERVLGVGRGFSERLEWGIDTAKGRSGETGELGRIARNMQFNEIMEQITLHLADVHEGSKRQDPSQQNKATPTPWWDTERSGSIFDIPSMSLNTHDSSYSGLGLNPIITCDIVEHKSHNGLRLDATGLSYLSDHKWQGFVDTMWLKLEGGQEGKRTGQVMLQINMMDETTSSYKISSGGWRDSGKSLRQLATIAACSGVDLTLNGVNLITWLMDETDNEVGLEVDVWYGKADGESEGWYSGVLEGFVPHKGRYSVLFQTGERAENVHPCSIHYKSGPLKGHFWSSSSPLWFDTKQMVPQSIVRWCARRAKLERGDPVYPAVLGGLLDNGRKDMIKIALRVFEGDAGEVWRAIIAGASKVGLVLLACNIVFEALKAFLPFAFEVGTLTHTPDLHLQPLSEVTRALSTIAATTPPSLPTPALPVINTDGSVTNAEIERFMLDLQESSVAL
eukprot:TRINITY_DN4282_c1_g1_i1.p1 TRINITY_DN4282_c1_g1~~TRINITY_DN4282_c1_g1_i1.p1  ORF type:complete len:521 (+),score=95.40 TRINITY_DN4282_c1_g1_i1:32-1594(+)